LPWEETDENIRSGHRSPDEFRQDSLRTIVLSEAEGIKAVIGKSKDREKTEVQSYLFDKSKGWAVDKAKAWFEQHHESEVVHERFSIVLPFGVMEKIANKPLLIRGVAMTAGVSRNFNIYTPEELQAFARKLVAAVTFVDGDFHGLRSNVWVCPWTVLAITESVVVRVCCRFGSGSWVIIGSGRRSSRLNV